VLGPRGGAAGIVDVIGGTDSSPITGGKIVPGFTAVKGFDVASGWGTVNAARFVPSLAAAARASHNGATSRGQASRQLARLEHAVSFSPDRIGAHGVSNLVGRGFLPGHPVDVFIDGKFVAKLRVGPRGNVSYAIRPAALHLSSGWHQVKLTSLLLTETGKFKS
jgi:hypothetical protein